MQQQRRVTIKSSWQGEGDVKENDSFFGRRISWSTHTIGMKGRGEEIYSCRSAGTVLLCRVITDKHMIISAFQEPTIKLRTLCGVVAMHRGDLISQVSRARPD